MFQKTPGLFARLLAIHTEAVPFLRSAWLKSPVSAGNSCGPSADDSQNPLRSPILRFPVFLAVFAAFAALIRAPASRAQESVVQIDPAQTKIEFSLSGTMHTVHGKFALKSSAIRFDPSTGKMDGAIVVDATSGESGNGGRDARMHREILESAKFPEIIFTPMQMKGAVAAEGASKVEVSGRFRLHGQEHDVTLPIEVKADGRKSADHDSHRNSLRAMGTEEPEQFLLACQRQSRRSKSKPRAAVQSDAGIP